MFVRIVSGALMLAGLCLSGLAAWLYVAVPAGPALAVAESNVNLGDRTPGQEMDVVFHLENRSGRSIHVLNVVVC
jgi:hypothetical protein